MPACGSVGGRRGGLRVLAGAQASSLSEEDPGLWLEPRKEVACESGEKPGCDITMGPLQQKGP